MKFRLGVDLGTNSIGWSMIALNENGEPFKVLRTGVRIFTDGRNPKDKTSLAVARRTARSARRRRDRYLKRRSRLFRTLASLELLPSDPGEQKKMCTLNPYSARSRAAEEKVHPFELGRALFHLNQRRGFKSSRKIQDIDEQKVIGPKIQATEAALGTKTLGQYLWTRMQNRKPVRCKHYLEDLYFNRSMLEREFTSIRQMQQKHQRLTEEQWDLLRKIIFFQRPLKSIEPAPCTLNPVHKRAPTALPSFQEFRILHEMSNLRIVSTDRSTRDLNYAERSKLFTFLNRRKDATWDQVRKELKLGDAEFNLESEINPKLKGNATAAFLSGKDRFGKEWFNFSLEAQDRLVLQILEENEEKLSLNSLIQALPNDRRQAILNISEAHLPANYCRFSLETLNNLLPLMKQWMRFEVAKETCGYKDRGAEISEHLEYYGKVLPESVVPLRQGNSAVGSPEEKRWGRVPNPTVHIGLTQLTKVVNRIIEAYGKPEEIHLEIVRDLKMNREQKSRMKKTQAENKRNNDRFREILKECGLPDSYDNRLRLRLWEELGADSNDRACPYSGKKISLTALFSENIEIEHILPWSQTLDDSAANKTLSFIECNREKKDRSPFQAWGHDRKRYEEILCRAAALPKNKRWRFDPNAIEQLREENGWLARQLTDTAYLARIARKFLATLVSWERVQVSPGRLTAFLRHQWGLNSLISESDAKNRTDHRHHAIDACVVAMADMGLLHRLSRAAASSRKTHHLSIDAPWAEFRHELKSAIDATIVSHRIDHSPQGRLFEETAYGSVAPKSMEGRQGFNLVARKPVTALSSKQLECIRDPLHRKSILGAVGSASGDKLKAALEKWGKDNHVTALRVLDQNRSAVAIQSKMLIPDNLNHVQVWKLPDGSLHKELIGVQGYEMLRRKNLFRRPHPAAKLVMKIHKGDTAILESKKTGKKELVLVFSLRPSNNQIACRRIETSSDDQVFYPNLNGLKNEKFRIVHVDEIGVIKDGGPRL